MPKAIASKLPLNFENLQHLSPAFIKGVEAEILEAFRDCNNRPKLKKGRVVKMELILTPVIDAESDDATCFEVSVAFRVHPVSRPHRLPAEARVSLNKNNQGFFHADFPDEPNAAGLFDEQTAVKK